MTIEEVTPEFFDSTVREPYHVFGSAKFNQLNRARAEEVYYLLFKDTKYRLGLIAGKHNNRLLSPFSAPFGGFIPIESDVRLQVLEEALLQLVNWATERGLNAIHITYPPPIYQESYLAKTVNVFYRNGFVTESIELNYHFDLNKFSDQYSQNIWRNARKNLNQALANGLVFVRCELDEQKQEAYDVIKVNRMTRGVPLRLTSDALRNTARIIEADYFLVKDSERSSIAAAIVFKVAPQIGQIIYWGDNPNYSSLKTMNFLSYKVFEYFKSKGLRCLDIGYSTVDSVPNYGLCEFKESIGCDIQPKLTFSKNL